MREGTTRDRYGSERDVRRRKDGCNPMVKSWWYLAGKTFYNLTRWWPRKQVIIEPLPEQSILFSVGDKGKVCFNQLPEQIREHEHYRDVYMFGDVLMNEKRVIVQYYPGGEWGGMETDTWEKTKDGWVLTHVPWYLRKR